MASPDPSNPSTPPLCTAQPDCPCAGERRVVRSSVLAAVGVACVGFGALGVVVPGLPTTVFLIVACWCFARSVPWLESRLVRVPLFRPFLHAVDGEAGMPTRAKVISLALMWVGIGGSLALLMTRDVPLWVSGVVAAAGVLGTYWIVFRIPGESSAERSNAAAAIDSRPASPFTPITREHEPTSARAPRDPRADSFVREPAHTDI